MVAMNNERHPEHQSRSYTYKRSWRKKKCDEDYKIVMTSPFRSRRAQTPVIVKKFKANAGA
jgi:hypothetical protein